MSLSDDHQGPRQPNQEVTSGNESNGVHQTPIVSPSTEEPPSKPQSASDPSPKNLTDGPSKKSTITSQELSSPVQAIEALSVRASSTPKTPNHKPSRDEIAVDAIVPATSPRIVRENSIIRDEDLQNELTPLLGSDCSESYVALEEGLHRQLRASNTRRGFSGWFSQTFCSTPWLSWLILLIIAALLLIVLLVARNLPMLLDQAFISELHSVSVLDISDSGLTVHVVGSTFVDYESIQSRFYGLALKVIALLIGGVTVVPTDASRVFVSGEGINRVHVLDVYAPEVLVDLIDHRLTEYDFITEAYFVDDSLTGLLEDLLKHNRSEPLPLSIEVDFTTDIKTKGIKFNARPVNIREDAVISPERMVSPLSVESLNLDLEREGIALNATLLLDILPIKLDFRSVQWDVAIADCDGKPSYLGLWESDPFTVKPNLLTEIDVKGNIERVPDNLLKVCKNGQSAFNQFVSKISNEGLLDIFVLATKTLQNAQNLPKWLYNILTLVDVNIEIPVSTRSGLPLGDYLSRLDITSMDLSIFLSQPGKLNVNTSCDFKAAVSLPISQRGFEASLSKWTSSVEILDGNATVGSASTVLSSGLAIAGDSGNTTSILGNLANWEFVFHDFNFLGDFVNRWLNEHKPAFPTIDADIKQVKLDLPLLNTTLGDITVKNINFDPKHAGVLQKSDEKFLDWLLKNMNISMLTVALLSSGHDWVTFAIEAEVFNPIPLSLDLNKQDLVFAILFEDAQIGNVTFHDLSFPQTHKRITIPALLQVDCATFAERNSAEKFVSLVLSGASNITIGVKGLQTAASTDLDQVVKHLHVPDITLPHLKFPHPDEDETSAKQELANGSPFLIEATIHILTSEVELLVFNPINNQAILVDLLLCQAIYEEHVLAYADNVGDMMIPPGIFRTKRIPYKVGSGVGGDILRRALNGELEVVVKSDMMVQVGEFSGQILLQIQGVTAKVRL